MGLLDMFGPQQPQGQGMPAMQQQLPGLSLQALLAHLLRGYQPAQAQTEGGFQAGIEGEPGLSPDRFARTYREGQTIPYQVEQRLNAFRPEIPSMEMRDRGEGREEELRRALGLAHINRMMPMRVL